MVARAVLLDGGRKLVEEDFNIVRQNNVNDELSQILSRACEALSGAPIERVWEAAQRCELLVTIVDPKRSTLARKAFKGVFPTADALGKALSERAPEVQSAALALLADVDEAAATEVFADLLRLDLTEEADVYRSVASVYHALIGKVAPAKLAEAWLAGRLPMSSVPTEGFTAIPIRRIFRAFLENHSLHLDEARLVEHHPELREGAVVLALLEELSVSGRFALTGSLITRLGELAYGPAIPAIQRALLREAAHHHHAKAGQALLDLGTPEAFAPLLDLLRAADGLDLGDQRLPLAITASIRVDPRTSFDRLKHLFDPEALSTPRGLQLARALLLGDAKLLRQDPRWLDFAVALLADERLPARELLLEYKLHAVVEAMKRAGIDPARRPPRTHPIPADRRWLIRYQAGEHEAVWDEIRTLEDSIRDPAVLAEAQAVADELMRRVRANLERIVGVLKSKKYKLRKGAKALAPPGPKTAAQLDAIEALLGRPLPLSVRAFHALVGEVSLLEKPDSGDGPWFEGFCRFEPLSPAPLKDVLAELQKDAKEEKAYPEPLRRRLARLYWADDPDFLEQPGEAGNDRPRYLDLLGSDADALIDLPRKGAAGAGEHAGFVAYLRRCLRGGGFLGLPEEEATHKQREALMKGFLPF